MKRSAWISGCGTYRYDLTRHWDDDKPAVTWIMLNPSTADGDVDDPTIRRCIGFARSWGYGGIIVRNLYALRATNPSELRRHPAPIGPENDSYLTECQFATLVVCAWGSHSIARTRALAVRKDLRRDGAPLHHLGLTKDGQPRHPLYLKGDLTPIPWEVAS